MRLNGSVVELKFVEKPRGHSIEGDRHFADSLFTVVCLLVLFAVFYIRALVSAQTILLF